jgi:hypothetical protein
MTAFFTHYCKKNKLATLFKLVVFSVLSVVFVAIAWAATSTLHIKSAELVPTEEQFALNADFEFNFSPEMEAAINKGVPLTFLVEFQVVSPRRYWFDDEVVTQTRQVTLSYYALSRQYLVNQENHQDSYISLQEAKENLSHLRDWRVLDKALLKKGEAYNAALRIRLDQSKLPKPLQVEAIGSDDWAMVSERYRWTPALGLN